MTAEEIKSMQRRIGAVADGFWGPISKAACIAHLRALMPKVSPWPKSDRASLRAFYGEPGDESQLVSFAFPLPMFYDGRSVKTTRCHKKVRDSLVRVLTRIYDLYKNNSRIMAAVQDFGGVFNFRNVRGGVVLSVHSWGAAIDLDAGRNAFKSVWPAKAEMPLEIMEEFAREGWISAGAFWGYDAMHFQATQ